MTKLGKQRSKFSWAWFALILMLGLLALIVYVDPMGSRW